MAEYELKKIKKQYEFLVTKIKKLEEEKTFLIVLDCIEIHKIEDRLMDFNYPKIEVNNKYVNVPQDIITKEILDLTTVK